MQSLKIFFIQSGGFDSVISGGNLYNQRMVEGLKDKGAKVTFIPLKRFPFPQNDDVEELRSHLEHIDDKSLVVLDSLVLGAVPDLIQTYSRQLKIIGLIHLPLHLDIHHQEKIREKFRLQELQCFNQVFSLVVPSAFTRDRLTGMGIQGSKIEVIRPGQDRPVTCRKYPQKPENLLCVSNISRRKRQLDLLKGLSDLKHLDWNLTLCGNTGFDPEYFESLRLLIEKADLGERVKFTGQLHHQELTTYYKQADLFVFPSDFESHPMVLAEAMAYKLPVVASQNGANEVILPPEITRFFRTGDVQELGKILHELMTLKSSYKNLTDACKTLKINLPDWEESITKFYHFLSRIK